VGAGALALSGGRQAFAAAAADAKATAGARLRLSSQLSRMPGDTLRAKVENLVRFGGEAIEVRPDDCTSAERIAEIKGLMAEFKIKVSAVCAADGPYIVPDPTARRARIDNAKRLMTGGAELGSTGVIMVPAFNSVKEQLQGIEGHAVLVEVLQELGEHGAKVGCPILLEPLNRKEAWFLRQVPHAAAIAREVGSPGVGVMGDFYHMNFEETSDRAAFLAAGAFLRHVHLASTRRVLPGQDDRNFVDGFRGLQMIGYQGFCSLECGCDGKPEEEIPRSFAFLRKQWEEATL
jgi:sugar phosphate isomerase/epimerase